MSTNRKSQAPSTRAQSQAPQIACPFCDCTDTALFSMFGSQLSVSTYWCNQCHTAFEKLKRASSPSPSPSPSDG